MPPPPLPGPPLGPPPAGGDRDKQLMPPPPSLPPGKLPNNNETMTLTYATFLYFLDHIQQTGMLVVAVMKRATGCRNIFHYWAGDWKTCFVEMCLIRLASHVPIFYQPVEKTESGYEYVAVSLSCYI